MVNSAHPTNIPSEKNPQPTGGDDPMTATSRSASEGDISSESDSNAQHQNYSSGDDSSSSDESLVLEGALEGLSDEDDDDGDNNNDETYSNSSKENLERTKRPTDKRRKLNGGKMQAEKKGSKNRKKKESEEILHVEFQFCDMNEKYFHGIKSFLSVNPVHTAHSSRLSDAVLENVSVGTIVTTEGVGGRNTPGDDVYAFGSVINTRDDIVHPRATGNDNHLASPLPDLRNMCMDRCPASHKMEMSALLNKSHARPAGFLIHGRMTNVPLEVVLAMHQQLVLDMDWAVKNAGGGEMEQKSLDFGALILLAPGDCGRGEVASSSSMFYKFFEDEIFANVAEFTYSFELPDVRGYGGVNGDKSYCTVIVMTKTGHLKGMEDLEQMIKGDPN
eukprot:CAMPEP_0194272494 /NCGR_PEP_ID=MMETSP0169-20130528/6057_1 /TAXON_ID=218684 /ORGANISM="Corethron pennatum, Strain L29A3" /LENGTH=388 /DNA_ID=CAMNT_0039015181 /DNA_START=31 /DNA_END=1197 /DNA_ORIENTATION=-